MYAFKPTDQAVHHVGRLAGFTDAILAIAATVLVLNLQVQHEDKAGGLGHQVVELRAAIAGLLLGFLWITGAWVLSHRQLRQLRGVDHYMTVLILSSALSITLIPFATQLLAEGYGKADFWVGVEAVAIVILIGVVLSALATDYAHRRGLLSKPADPSARKAALTIWYVIIGIGVLSCVVAPWAPWFSFALIVLTRISAVLPLGSDRSGYVGDPSADI
jgi:uncharacterized membrane protein